MADVSACGAGDCCEGFGNQQVYLVYGWDLLFNSHNLWCRPIGGQQPDE